jgi:nicotinamide-nucleotide amidase
MTCAILTIGTELTRGELTDKNGGWLADNLTALGHQVTEIVSVDDDDARIIGAITRLTQTHEFVISTGGLGPTTDDRTSACVARAMGVPLQRDEEVIRHLQELFRSHGREMTPSNEKQADFPTSALVLPNSRGTAPGFSCFINAARLFVLPGVPSEMERMFEKTVMPLLPQSAAEQICLRLRSFGIPEAEVNDRLSDVEDTFGVTLGYRASNSEIEIKVLAMGDDRDVVLGKAEAAALVVEERLGAAIYARGAGSLSLHIGELLSARHLTLGLAESCTGGLLSQMMTQNPGASGYFKGGVCSYSNDVKVNLLAVPEEVLRHHGAVSEMVARKMAEGAKAALGCDLSLAITGVAGPLGGTDDKPVGLVHFAVAGPFETISEHKTFRGTRALIQRRASDHGLWMLRGVLYA